MFKKIPYVDFPEILAYQFYFYNFKIFTITLKSKIGQFLLKHTNIL